MDVIKTQREYEALDKEIKDATEKEQQLRKELQREQTSGEELKSALEKEEMMIRKQEEDVKEEQSKIKVKIKEKNAELKKLQGEEKKITPGLDEDILFKFERIIKSKSGLGIVSLTKGVCTGCYMILPPQFVNTVRLGRARRVLPLLQPDPLLPGGRGGREPRDRGHGRGAGRGGGGRGGAGGRGAGRGRGRSSSAIAAYAVAISARRAPARPSLPPFCCDRAAESCRDGRACILSAEGR